ncbi:MAG TPA: PaaI family thioesterase [Pyrinomonadaceae bacterium]|nr:PaaI family thioesterase [Pyrinomonadaceae bacterium]
MQHQATNPTFVEEIQRSFARQTVMTLIGGELTRVEAGVIEITLPYRSDLTQQHGYVHAGVITTIADSACGYAAYTLMPAGSDVLAVEFKVNLLRPAKGDTFVARAEVIKSGRTLTVVRADVHALARGEQRELVAIMQGTMMRLKRPSPNNS